MNPGDVRAHANLAVVYAQKEQVPEAVNSRIDGSLGRGAVIANQNLHIGVGPSPEGVGLSANGHF